MQSRLFDEDPLTGITRIFHYDDSTGQATIETRQDIEPQLIVNHEHHKLYDERANWKGDMHCVASVPLPLYFQLKKKGYFRNDAGKLSKDDKKWLNDADNKPFRTRPGRV